MGKDALKHDNTQRPPAFIADCHLGKLARYLRFMRIDTLYFAEIDDNDLITLAHAEGRTILTRDRALSRRKGAPLFLLESDKLSEQLRTLNRRFHLNENTVGMRRCIVCNAPLQVVEKSAIADRVPEKVARSFDYFERCPGCGRIYWHGDHYRRMCRDIDTILGT